MDSMFMSMKCQGVWLTKKRFRSLWIPKLLFFPFVLTDMAFKRNSNLNNVIIKENMKHLIMISIWCLLRELCYKTYRWRKALVMCMLIWERCLKACPVGPLVVLVSWAHGRKKEEMPIQTSSP